MTNNSKQEIETLFHNDMKRYLTSINKVDEHFPEFPDLEEVWPKIGESYLADGIREFNQYPTVSLGWMMYIGMAVAKYWDVEWEVYKNVPDLYRYMLDKTDFDHLDDYICSQILYLDEAGRTQANNLVAECASRTCNMLCHQHLAAGSPEAFKAYVAALHQMYVMGIAVELKELGYHMSKL